MLTGQHVSRVDRADSHQLELNVKSVQNRWSCFRQGQSAARARLGKDRMPTTPAAKAALGRSTRSVECVRTAQLHTL